LAATKSIADGDTGAAADAGGGVHGAVGDVFGNREGVGVGRAAGAHGDKAAGLDDAVEGGAVDDEVFDERKGLCAPGLEGERVAVL